MVVIADRAFVELLTRSAQRQELFRLSMSAALGSKATAAAIEEGQRSARELWDRVRAYVQNLSMDVDEDRQMVQAIISGAVLSGGEDR